MTIARAGLIATLLAATVGTAASAAPVVYTNRAAWEAAAGAVTTETFSSPALGTTVNSSTVFASGIQVSPLVSGVTDISNFAFSSIGQGNALRTSVDLTITLGGSPTVFGFDYGDLEQPATVSFGNYTFSLAITGDADAGVTPDDFAFFGIIAGPGDIPGGAFTFRRGDVIVMDNLSFGDGSVAVPEPAMLGLFGMGALALGIARRRKA